MIRPVRLFLCALQFLTRLPTPAIPFEPDMIARAAPFYPVVGWVVGGLSAAVFLAASRLWPGWPAAVLAIGAGVLITGGFHEDGLADTADGLGGGQTPARRLEIMKDSRLGSYGALALWAALTMKAAALASLPALAGALVLVLVHGAARAVAVVVMASLAYARDPDAAKLRPAPVGVRPGEAGTAVLLGVAPLAAASLIGLSPWAAITGAILAALAGGAVALTARRLIGGYTGDVLGAVEQVAEVGLLLGLSVRWPA